MAVEPSDCLGCGLGVDSVTGLPSLLGGCGVECRNGRATWTRRSLQSGIANIGLGTITPAATPVETIINSQTLTLINTTCGPVMARYQLNIGSPGMQIASGNNWLLRWYVSLDGGPLTQIHRVRFGHSTGGLIVIDWPSTEWSLVLLKNVGQTASIGAVTTFQTFAFVANPSNLISETGYNANIDMRPEGVL